MTREEALEMVLDFAEAVRQDERSDRSNRKYCFTEYAEQRDRLVTLLCADIPNTRAGATPLNPKPRRPTMAVDEGGRTVGSIPATGAKQGEWETDEEYGKRMYDFLNNHDIEAEKCK